ncbi:MAG: porin [Methylococcales bacterium]
MKLSILNLSEYKKIKALILFATLSLPIAGYCEESLDMNSVYKLVKQQQKTLQQQQKQIEELRKLVFQQQKIVSQRLDKAEHKVKKIARSSTKVSISKKGLRVKSKDGNFSFRAGGRIHADYAHYNNDISKMGNGAALRRARVYFKGKVSKNWRYKAEIDFSANGKVGPRGVWLGYNGWKPISLKLGNFQESFSLEEMNSSNAITFMERSLANTFAPSYRLGFGASGHGDFWGLSTGIFADTLSSSKGNDIGNGWAVASRATLAPLLFENKFLHLGVSSEYRQTGTRNRIRLRTRPESGVTKSYLINTNYINNVDHTWLIGTELAAAYGPISLQGEYIHNKVFRTVGTNLDFYGAYVQGSWILTGESRPYNAKQGIFTKLTPLHNYGAWELALRYSTLNLDNNDITGGKEDNFTLGLNWYANYNVRFMLNYVFVNAHPNLNGIEESPNIFQMRGQLVF